MRSKGGSKARSRSRHRIFSQPSETPVLSLKPRQIGKSPPLTYLPMNNISPIATSELGQNPQRSVRRPPTAPHLLRMYVSTWWFQLNVDTCSVKLSSSYSPPLLPCTRPFLFVFLSQCVLSARLLSSRVGIQVSDGPATFFGDLFSSNSQQLSQFPLPFPGSVRLARQQFDYWNSMGIGTSLGGWSSCAHHSNLAHE